MVRISQLERGESSTPQPNFTPTATLLEYMKVTQVKKNPYKVNGPALPVSIWEPEGGGGFVRVRVDMPGVNSVVIDPNPHENSIGFKGVEQSVTMHGICKSGNGVCRIYEGSLSFDCLRFPGLEFTHEFRNGVLLFQIRSRRPAKSTDLGVLLKTHQTGTIKESAFNPMVSQGKDRFCHHGFTKKAFLLAVDMPGIGEHDFLSLQVVGNTIYFFAEDRIPASYGESVIEKRREYEGHFKVNLEEFDPNIAQFEIVHGVFWILVPRIVKPPTELVTIFHDVHAEKVVG